VPEPAIEGDEAALAIGPAAVGLLSTVLPGDVLLPVVPDEEELPASGDLLQPASASNADAATTASIEEGWSRLVMD
jgi:hypothetical protein